MSGPRKTFCKMPLMHQVQVFPSCTKHDKNIKVKQSEGSMIKICWLLSFFWNFLKKTKNRIGKKQQLSVTFSLNDLYQRIFGKKTCSVQIQIHRDILNDVKTSKIRYSLSAPSVSDSYGLYKEQLIARKLQRFLNSTALLPRLLCRH